MSGKCTRGLWGNRCLQKVEEGIEGLLQEVGERHLHGWGGDVQQRIEREVVWDLGSQKTAVDRKAENTGIRPLDHEVEREKNRNERQRTRFK